MMSVTNMRENTMIIYGPILVQQESPFHLFGLTRQLILVDSLKLQHDQDKSSKYVQLNYVAKLEEIPLKINLVFIKKNG